MAEKDRVPQLPLPLTILIAVNGSARTSYAVIWALQRFSKERILFKLLHVFPTITAVPTDMGNYIPISEVRPDIVDTYKKEMQWERNKMLNSYKRFITGKKSEAEIMPLIEDDDIPQAIARAVRDNGITKLVVGASSSGWFTRVFKGQGLSSRICKCVPDSCSVYVVSRDDKVAERSSTSEADATSYYYQRNNSSKSTTTTTASLSSSQPGAPHFEPLSSMMDASLNRSASYGSGHPINATPSRPPSSSFKSFFSRSSRGQIRSLNSDLAPNYPSSRSSSERQLQSPSMPSRRIKEAKQ
ncbi:hypothetical protein Scep_026690 [Stephania cephalantha]|uniref:UspA domain-containing protein n=1 Tax=Stephania cephalantha TaxID=152367 RepID=A0AAP0HSU3_9MAGN